MMSSTLEGTAVTNNNNNNTSAAPPAVQAPDTKKNQQQQQQQQQQEHHSLSHAYNTYLAHDVDEKQHWEDVCRAFRQYATFAMAQWANHQYRLHALPEEQRRYLPSALRRESPEFQQRAKLYKEAAIRNQFCFDCILRHAGQPNSQDVLHHHQQQPPRNAATVQHSTDAQMSKVSAVLKSLARDWSAEGKVERDMAYRPILDAVQRYLPMPSRSRSSRTKKRARPTTAPAAATADAVAAFPASSHQAVHSMSVASATEPVGVAAVQPKQAPSPPPPPPRLCVPGAGVGRLACELAARGYAVQGNEFSLYMLLASDFILNGGMATPSRQLQISPYLLESRNVHVSTDPLRPLQIPDVDPYQMILGNNNNSRCNQRNNSNSASGEDSESDTMMELSAASSSPSNSSQDEEDTGSSPSAAAVAAEGNPQTVEQADFSMAAGEFCSIYGNARERGKWDGFVACFFMDTAPSIIEYITVMHRALKPGGLVFHFGPLLWHWSGPCMRPDDRTWSDYQCRYNYLDKKYMTSMDLAWVDVKNIFINVGFDIVEEEIGVQAMYTSDKRSMMNMSYNCIQFIARKKKNGPVPPPPPQPAAAPAADGNFEMNNNNSVGSMAIPNPLKTSTARIPPATNLPTSNVRPGAAQPPHPPMNRQGSGRLHGHNTRNKPKPSAKGNNASSS